MVSTNFILTSIFIAIISSIVIKIFTPEINSFTQNVRNSKPIDNMEVGKIGS